MASKAAVPAVAFPWFACNLLRISAVAAENWGNDGPDECDVGVLVVRGPHVEDAMGTFGVLCAVNVETAGGCVGASLAGLVRWSAGVSVVPDPAGSMLGKDNCLRQCRVRDKAIASVCINVGRLLVRDGVGCGLGLSAKGAARVPPLHVGTNCTVGTEHFTRVSV